MNNTQFEWAETAPEVTDTMIEAGTDVLWKSGITDEPAEVDRLLVEDIFRAMWNHRPGTLGARQSLVRKAQLRMSRIDI